MRLIFMVLRLANGEHWYMLGSIALGRFKMKYLTVLVTTFLLASVGRADVEARLTIELAGLAEAQGNIYISVYDNEDDWLGEDTIAYVEVSIRDSLVNELVVADVDLPVGDYAVSIYYDKNGNGDLDTNFIGIPKEPVALSNNAKPRFGPPKYKDAVFTLPTEGITQRIEMTEI